jgi:hypothetical protein
MAFTASTWGQGRLLTGLTPGSSLSGFTAVITKDNLPTSALDTGSLSCLNGGGDWRFSTDINGSNQLDCEIITCITNATASSTEFLVKIRFPTYASGTREVYAFWNKAGQSQPLDGAAFGRDACNAEFSNVYNLEEAAAGPFVDSTGNTNATATNSSALTSVTAANAALGKGIDFDATTGSSIKATLTISAYPYTLSAWHKIEAFGNGTISGLATSNIDNQAQGVRVSTSNKIELYSLAPSGFTSAASTSSYSVGDVVFVEVTFRSSTDAELYVNGSSEATLNSGHAFPQSPRALGLAVIPRLNAAGLNNCEIYRATTRATAITADQAEASYDNQNNPSTYWTLGTVFVPGGGGGITISLAESGPSFTDSISSTVTGNITAAIVGTGPSFTDSITVAVTSAGVISASIIGAGPSFTDAVASVVTGSITASIVNVGPSFTDSVNSTVTGSITTSIIEVGPSFTDAVLVAVTLPGSVDVSIIESGPKFIEYILTSIPVNWTDKAPATTTWTDSSKSSTIWQDK